MGTSIDQENAKALLKTELRKYRDQLGDETLNDDKIFEYFVTDNYLKERNLGISDISRGLVGGSNDWGVDGMFLFLNDQQIFVPDDLEMSDEEYFEELGYDFNNRSVFNFEIYIFQFKNKEKFEENVINKLNIFADKLLNLNEDYLAMKKQNAMNPNLLKNMAIFQYLVLNLNNTKNKISLNVIHASQGDTEKIQNTYIEKKNLLEGKFEKSNLIDEVKFGQIGAGELVILNRKEVPVNAKLISSSTPLSTEFGVEGENIGYIATVKIKDYFNFISFETDNGDRKLNEKIFDANIRDYMNRSTINQQIENTVSAGARESQEDMKADFWWLNNGITILADEGTVRGMSFNLENIQIVNGLQTSYSIFRALKNINNEDLQQDSHSVFVKIIITTDNEVRDEIIKSTNSQNALAPSSLHATDPIQRNIEIYLKENGYYYDRRKNYYRNQGIDATKIFDTNYLVQALVSILRQKPSKARSNPTILIKKDEDYNDLFGGTIKLEAYLAVVKIRKTVDMLMKKIEFGTSSKYFDDVKKYYSLHVAWIVASIITQKSSPSSQDLTIAMTEERGLHITEETIKEAVSIAEKAINEFDSEHKTRSPADLSKLDGINLAIRKQINIYLQRVSK
ncbi:5-carboxyvanillate decarboxylase LigW (lignin degradation) [Fructobacillus cardui]|uniref:AIPR family protein n=1 Tax=Fructobacillus cardui TaxID=2893170 RepID=UPI002D97E507|nr:5-carboxyvanillate decarboxylase LigW (lignin degradation) [Fructobacillus cardui]